MAKCQLFSLLIRKIPSLLSSGGTTHTLLRLIPRGTRRTASSSNSFEETTHALLRLAPRGNSSHLVTSSFHCLWENSSRHLCVQFPTLPLGETAHAIFACSFREQLTPFLHPVSNITLGGNNSHHLCFKFPPSRSGHLPNTF